MTFTVKLRGHPSATIAAEYLCDEHGRFEVDVTRTPDGDAPDSVPCPGCASPCIWVISSPRVKVKTWSVERGGWQKPERSTYTDTRNLGEGQDLDDWRADRKAVWEERRREDVVRFARENHERVIGGD